MWLWGLTRETLVSHSHRQTASGSLLMELEHTYPHIVEDEEKPQWSFSSALKHSFVIKSFAKQKTRFNLKCIWQCFCVRSRLTGSSSSLALSLGVDQDRPTSKQRGWVIAQEQSQTFSLPVGRRTLVGEWEYKNCNSISLDTSHPRVDQVLLLLGPPQLDHEPIWIGLNEIRCGRQRKTG